MLNVLPDEGLLILGLRFDFSLLRNSKHLDLKYFISLTKKGFVLELPTRGEQSNLKISQ